MQDYTEQTIDLNQLCIALVDVNNFYASRERLFRPDLKGRMGEGLLRGPWP
ncbi:hypothetical protein [Aeromonas sp. 604534]|uniref:hypothetical protein n=1 Tax=Aeromonas sp. 604534 TaxID=2712055 RepID=UPI003BA22986